MKISDVINSYINIWKGTEELYVKLGKAKNIDADNYIFDFEPIDETSTVLDVRMKTVNDSIKESFIIVPKEGVNVIVAFHSNEVAQCIYVSEAEEIIIKSDNLEVSVNNKNETISSEYNLECNDVNVLTNSWDFNTGSLGGLIIISNLTTKLNDLVSELNSLKDSFNSHVHSDVRSGTSNSGTPNSSVSAFTSFDKDDYEDTKIRH